MAHVIHNDYTRLTKEYNCWGEMTTLKRLESSLPDQYTVFHRVHWTLNQGNVTHAREVDFVVLHRSGILICIEQKNGPLEETRAAQGGGEGTIAKRYPRGTRDPVDQMLSYITHLKSKFQECYGPTLLNVRPLLYCPDHKLGLEKVIGIDRSSIADAQDRVGERVRALIGDAASEDRPELHEKLRTFLSDEFTMKEDLDTYAEESRRLYLSQVTPLAQACSRLEIRPKPRMRVIGAAGSGMDVLASVWFQVRREQGKRVLLLCCNRLLAEEFRKTLPYPELVTNFHRMCHEFLRKKGDEPDFRAARKNLEFWKKLSESVLDHDISEEEKFDALVVADGQDFEAEWHEIVKCFLVDGYELLWLEDPDQNIRGISSMEQEEFSVVCRFPVNYRTPVSIARFIRNVLPEFRFEQGCAIPGEPVGLWGWDRERKETQRATVSRIIQDWRQEGMRDDQMVVLSMYSLDDPRSAFVGQQDLEGVRLTRFTKEYDDNSQPIHTQGQVVFESVGRFKGEERMAVALVDVDPQSELERKRLYCGMTRSIRSLHVLVCEQNDLYRTCRQYAKKRTLEADVESEEIPAELDVETS